MDTDLSVDTDYYNVRTDDGDNSRKSVQRNSVILVVPRMKCLQNQEKITRWKEFIILVADPIHLLLEKQIVGKRADELSRVDELSSEYWR